ncbi:bone morphogenetic protein 3-like [Phyllostomus discolor]|uniref:Bone morphogenetic protein 3-like n=1 Tax=Phyllostomus discolor TaxID=89673 RepID=A0A7E6DCY6_9CHIR|nr:bone morphogenetic protein 3-like [Phyllostomus discolor]
MEWTRHRDLAMTRARRLLCLWLGCFCVSLAQGERLKQHFPELSKTVPGDLSAGGVPGPLLQPHDKVSEHMLRLYDRYSGVKAKVARTPGSSERGAQPLRPKSLREGNTVRSFRAGTAGECPRSTPFCGPAPGLPHTPSSIASSSDLGPVVLPGDLSSPSAAAL